MKISADAEIEPLGPSHDRAAFSCGNSDPDEYLKRRAGQDERRNIARVFVLVGNKPNVIAGYYTVSSAGILMKELPDELAGKLPTYPQIPGTLIGRLAVSTHFQGQGLGGVLLIDALNRIILAGGDIASYAVVVDANNENAASFYERYGFRKFPTHPHRLFLPVETARQVFSGQGG